MLRHLGSGADLSQLPVSASEKVALVKTANQRGLIAWHKSRGRYELTAAGWCELAPTRRFGVGSIMVGTSLGATLGAAALAVFWFTAGAAHVSAPGQRSATAPVSAQLAKLSAPAVDGAASGPALVASTPDPVETTASTAAPPAPAPAPAVAPAPVPAREVAPAAAPTQLEPSMVAEEPAPEQSAEAAKAKRVAAKKARQRAAARRHREEAARAWAAGESSRTREAEYSNHGVYGGYGYGGYGGGNSWFAYR